MWLDRLALNAAHRVLPELTRFVERVLGEETMDRMLAEVVRAASPPKNKPGGGEQGAPRIERSVDAAI